MKKYNVFSLYVITIDKHKFICESIIYREKYREVLTGRKFDLKENYLVEKLSDYYCILGVMNYTTGEPLMLSKDDILRKYIDINMPEIEDEYYQEQTDLSSIIDNVIEKPDIFYRKVGEELTQEERNYIKSLIQKSCDNCSNIDCRVEQVDKPIYKCINWKNDRIIGEYKVLKLNRKKQN